VAARNILGEGPLSDEFVVFIEDLPEVMAPVTTAVVGTDVVLSWVAPFDNYDPIIAYQIQFVAADGSLVTICPDTAALSCAVDMHVLIAATGLRRGQLVRA
jgi:hypothetical protein